MTGLKASREIFTIEGGNHSFHVPRVLHRSDEDIFAGITAKAVEWLADRGENDRDR